MNMEDRLIRVERTLPSIIEAMSEIAELLMELNDELEQNV